MSYGQYRDGIPTCAPEDTYDAPPELGGRRANYPIVNNVQQYGLFNEVRTDWYGEGSQLWEAWGFPRYDGEVWSIQLTARPGYYVTPEQLESMGYDVEEDFPPFG